MSSLCTLLGYSRQAYYGKNNHHLQQVYEAELVLQQVLKHRQQQPKIGTRKLIVLMQDFAAQHQFSIGRDGLFDLLRAHGLLIRKRRRNVQTTFSRHRFHKYKNLIRGFEPLAANLLWVSDITYIVVADGHGYLSLVTDAYSRKIVGYYLSETLAASGSVKALQMALAGCEDVSKLIHHSDRGVQYCCNEYVNLLTAESINISMTENGDPLENAIAERVNGILKCELLQEKYSSFEQAENAIAKAGAIYNTLRPHSSCDMLTPMEAHKKSGVLKRRWKNYYKKKEVEMASP